VAHSKYFIAFVPFAAKIPYEIWIIPMRHTSDFGSITEDEKTDLASMLKDLLSRLFVKLQDPAYNYVIHSYSRYETDVPFLHWYIQIVPRLNTPAGFELGSGFTINSSIPENDAANLNH
jgi:UDPglucose--hexose-1-phosphate uridylyltransferase